MHTNSDLTILCIAMMLSTMSIGVAAADIPEIVEEATSEDIALASEVTQPLLGEGTAEAPYTVNNLEEFKAFRDYVNSVTNAYASKYVLLKTDIDLNDEEWTPIGNSSHIFKGTFDGGNHTISNLKVTSGRSDVGLFGFTSDGELKNLTINNAVIKGRLDVGAFVGTPYTSKMTNLTLTGDVCVEGFAYVGGMFGKNLYANGTNLKVNVSDSSYVFADSTENGAAYRTYVGGIVGFIGEGSHGLYNVTSNIKVTGTVCDIGGITGIAHYGNKFENVVCSGDVTSTNPNEEDMEIGGIAGVWHNEAGTSVSFNDCHYSGTIEVEGYEGDIDLSQYAVAGPAYSASGGTAENQLKVSTSVNTVAMVETNGVVSKFSSLAEAFEAIENGSTVAIYGGVYEGNYSFDADDVTVVGDGNVTIKGKLTAGVKGTLTMPAINFNIKNISIEAESGQAVDIAGNGKFSNCNIKSGEHAIAWAVARSDEGYGVIFENCTIEAKDRAIHFDTLKSDSFKVIGGTIKGNVQLASGTTAEFENVAFETGIGGEENDFMEFWGNAKLTGCTFAPSTKITSCLDGKLVLINNSTVSDGSDIFDLVDTDSEGGIVVDDAQCLNIQAKIGDAYYKTLEDALAAAKSATEAVEITLLTDVEASSIEKSTHATFSNAITINLNGHTYKVVETPNYLYSDITFKNGTVEIEEGMYNAQAFFQLYNDGMTLTFDNVTLKANNYTSNGGFINVNASDADVVFVDSVVELSDEKSGGFIMVNGKRGTNEIKIIGTEMNLTDVDVAFTNAMITIADNDDTNKRSLIKITGTKENGVTKAINNAASITVDDSDVIITGATEYGIAHNGDFGPLSLTGTARVIVKDTISKVDIARSKYTPDNVQSEIKVADTAVLEAGYINIPAEDITGPVVSKADEINLEFRGVEKTNNREWEIWITGENAETINKMKSAHFVFDNKNKALDYTVEASKGISIVGDIDNEDKMAFYINTLDSVVYPTVDDITNAKTAAEIMLGKVTFDGYGTIDFGVTNDAKVNATTISDSIVETFIPNGTAYVLDITNDKASIKNAEIVEATRSLNVKLSFNNDVAKTNDACYNDMTVTVTGTNGYIKTGKVGSECAEAPADVYAQVVDDNVATLVFTGENALPAGYRYTVKAEGAGYRTAEYTTVVGTESTDDVTLTFWNNVKDEFNKTEIESGSDRWYTKNFLAGEIVQDNKINKYDLAAVVSYFGEDDLVASRPEYNKYDLNRDGVIDSEDIAYVLVAFGE